VVNGQSFRKERRGLLTIGRQQRSKMALCAHSVLEKVIEKSLSLVCTRNICTCFWLYQAPICQLVITA
jgi:hypothetical protein